MYKAEIIRGGEAIRESVQDWHRFVTEQWRTEPLRMKRGCPKPDGPYTAYDFEFEHGWVGEMGAFDKMRFLDSGCVMLAFDHAKDPTKPRPVLHLDSNPGPYAHQLRGIARFRLEEKVVYDPIAVLYNLLIRRASLVPEIDKKPLTAAEIIELS
jgi:hypothetical protein